MGYCMARGGKRSGAGRKLGYRSQKTYLAGEAKNQLIHRVLKEWDELIETKLRIALGDYYIEKTDTNNRKIIYRAKPDTKSINDLIEFVIGKPQQPIDNTINATITSPAIDQLTLSMRQILESGK